IADERGWCHAHEDRAWPLDNVWLGVSAEDQQRADERIPMLLQTPAAVRFVSAEPLLGSVELRKFLGESCCGQGVRVSEDEQQCCGQPDPGLDWVIVGGESGPGARHCNTRWISSI